MKYQLRCLASKNLIDDDYTLHHTEGALLQTEYCNVLKIDNQKTGLAKFQNWMPHDGFSENLIGTVTYKSVQLQEALGMSDLWITFH